MAIVTYSTMLVPPFSTMNLLSTIVDAVDVCIVWDSFSYRSKDKIVSSYEVDSMIMLFIVRGKDTIDESLNLRNP